MKNIIEKINWSQLGKEILRVVVAYVAGAFASGCTVIPFFNF